MKAETPKAESRNRKESIRDFAPDEQVCPRLASYEAMCRLLISAKRDPGESKVGAFDAEYADDLSGLARHHEFAVDVAPHAINASMRSISVKWPRK